MNISVVNRLLIVMSVSLLAGGIACAETTGESNSFLRAEYAVLGAGASSQPQSILAADDEKEKRRGDEFGWDSTAEPAAASGPSNGRTTKKRAILASAEKSAAAMRIARTESPSSPNATR